MARRMRPAGVQTKKEEEDGGRTGRKLYALHKNMHSFGFMIGTDAVAQQYFEKVSLDLQHRFQSVEPPKRDPAVLPPVQDIHYLRQELQRKDAELRQVKKSFQALLRVNHDEQHSERTPVRRVDAEVETETYVDIKPQNRVSSQSPGSSSAFGMQESTHNPAFHVIRYTRKRPKVLPPNPILGYRINRRPSPETSSYPQRNSSFAEYGSMILK